MKYSKIMGTGSYLPKNSLSNETLAERIETSNEWIVDRTGIQSRHIASEGETTTSMGVFAAKKALEAAGRRAEEVEMVVVATCTPDKMFPSTACLIQAELGVPAGPAFDVQAACSGFIYGLSIVDQFIRTGMVKNALLIGSETMSKVVDWSDRRTCILFGDGAGAVFLEASSEPGILQTHISAEGKHQDILYLDNKPNATLQMQGNAVFKIAVNMLDSIAGEALQSNHLKVEDLDWLVPHQANVRIIQAMAEKLGLPMDKVMLTLATQGNTSSASIPLALDAGIQAGKIKKDQMLLLEAFGGGLTWGTALVRY